MTKPYFLYVYQIRTIFGCAFLKPGTAQLPARKGKKQCNRPIGFRRGKLGCVLEVSKSLKRLRLSPIRGMPRPNRALRLPEVRQGGPIVAHRTRNNRKRPGARLGNGLHHTLLTSRGSCSSALDRTDDRSSSHSMGHQIHFSRNVLSYTERARGRNGALRSAGRRRGEPAAALCANT